MTGPEGSNQALAVVAMGDPTDPRVWSGTPSNLVRALEDGPCAVTPIDASLHETASYILKAWGRLAGYDGAWERSGSGARRLARLADDRLRLLRPAGALHLTTATLPTRPTPRWNTYLLTDCTWMEWSTYTVDGPHLPDRINKAIRARESRRYRSVDHIFAVSEHVQDSLTSAYGISSDRVTVVGTGLGGSAAGSVETRNYASKNVLMVAKNRHGDKGAHLLIDAFAAVREVHPTATLTLVAGKDGPTALPAPEGVTITGYLTDLELKDVYQRACLFAMPALNEPWGLVYLEALAAGIPVMGLDRLAIPEITANGRFGYIVDRPSPEAVSVAIIAALNRPDELRAKGEAGQEHVARRYSWLRTADRIIRQHQASVRARSSANAQWPTLGD